MSYKISDELEQIADSSLNITYRDTTITPTIDLTWSGEVIKMYLKAKYSDYKSHLPFIDLWNTYRYLTERNFYRMMSAWLTDYNPLDNYNSKELNITLNSDGVTTTTRTPDEEHNTVTASATEDNATENYITTDDTATPRLENKLENKGGTVTTDDMIYTVETDSKETSVTFEGVTYTADEVHIEKRNKSGNIGITKSTDMLLDEISARMKDLVCEYLDHFVHEYFYYVGGSCFECNII